MLKLRHLRQERGLSQLQLSYESRVAAPFISQAESGRRRPYPGELERLALALGWSGDPAELLREVSDDATDNRA